MATLRELRTRIGSVASSEKITGAMKMISSAKVHKNEAELKELMPYKNQIQSIMGHLLSAGQEYDSPLIQPREVSKVAVVVFGSDEGLCGAYNINILKRLLVEFDQIREKYGSKTEIDVYPAGEKIRKALKRFRGAGFELREQEGICAKMDGKTVTAFAHQLKDGFLSGDYDLVLVVYMKFHSMSRQRLTVEQLFPITEDALKAPATTADATKNTKKASQDENRMYIFEPDPNSIFNTVLPMFVLSSMNEITIHNRASEQAARVMAMQSANDNAHKLLEELQLEFNKMRQQSITTELLDIVGGQIKR